MIMQELYIHLKEKINIDNIKVKIKDFTKYYFEHPYKNNKYILCSSKEQYDYAYDYCKKATDDSCPYSICVFNIAEEGFAVANINQRLYPTAHQIIKWIYSNFKNQITLIKDDYGKDWTNKVKEEGIEVLF